MSNNAFLVRLSISLYTARKLDKSATRDTKERANATDKAKVKVYKTLLASEELDTIERIANEARGEHKKRTVPWQYDGPGAITAEGYPAYKAAMAVLGARFYEAVDRFVMSYSVERKELVNNASHPIRKDLGALFNAADYPDAATIKLKFSFNVAAEPIPDAADFRVRGLDPMDVVEIVRDMDNNKAAAFDNANATAWGRVIEAVEKLKLRLAEYSRGDVTKFYDAWLDNVAELITLIPSINVANDPDLVRVGQKLVALTAYSNKDLKEDSKLRDTVVRQAGDILNQIAVAQVNQTIPA